MCGLRVIRMSALFVWFESCQDFRVMCVVPEVIVICVCFKEFIVIVFFLCVWILSWFSASVFGLKALS